MMSTASSLTEDRGLLLTFGTLALICLLAVVLYASKDPLFLEIETLSRIATLIFAAVFIFMSAVAIRGLFSVSMIYTGVFAMFHFALLPVLAVDLSGTLADHERMSSWMGLYMNHAIILVCVGLIALALGVCIAYLSSEPMRSSDDFAGTGLDQTFAWAGLLLMACSICAWFLRVISSGGIGLLFVSYLDFLEMTSGSEPSFGYIYHFIGVGLVFLVVASPSWPRTLGLIAFAGFSLIALPLGLRGEILFPVFAAIAVAGMRGWRLPLSKTLVLLTFLLFTISFIKQLRDYGLSSVEMENITASPVAAMVELGSSIRPVIVVVGWFNDDEDLIYGASYWAPFDRMLYYLIPGWTRPLAAEDDRLLNVLVQERVGPIGFSPVAEGYRNFGTFGVILYMFFLGFMFGRIDLWPATQPRMALTGIILLPLLIQVRNAFTQVPFQLIVGIVLLLIVTYFINLGLFRNKGGDAVQEQAESI